MDKSKDDYILCRVVHMEWCLPISPFDGLGCLAVYIELVIGGEMGLNHGGGRVDWMLVVMEFKENLHCK
jgi:hypothetical protein